MLDRRKAMARLTGAFLRAYPQWERWPGHNRFGPYLGFECNDLLFLTVSFGMHHTLETVSPRIGWRDSRSQPERAQDPEIRGQGTLSQVLAAASPDEFQRTEFSVPLGKLIARGVTKSYSISDDDQSATMELIRDFESIGLIYFKTFLRARKLDAIAERLESAREFPV